MYSGILHATTQQSMLMDDEIFFLISVAIPCAQFTQFLPRNLYNSWQTFHTIPGSRFTSFLAHDSHDSWRTIHTITGATFTRFLASDSHDSWRESHDSGYTIPTIPLGRFALFLSHYFHDWRVTTTINATRFPRFMECDFHDSWLTIPTISDARDSHSSGIKFHRNVRQ